MRLIIQKDYEAMSQWAAAYILKRIQEFAPGPGRPFVLGLPTGSTPLGVYREFIRYYQEGRLSFKHIVTFNMDEYIGLSPEHPQSYHRFMQENLFSHVDIPAENIHIPNGMAQDLKAECERYEATIRHYGGIELFLGGMGGDGHLAFNEPGSSLSSRTRDKELTRDTRRANARFFGGDPEKVPAAALTVGLGTIMDAREVVVLASGPAKARALQAAVEGPVTHLWPVSILQLHPRAIIVCDEEATEELKVGTVRYFKEIEGLA
ncbi:glucosamine-6-phosphate deaminase [Treponema sp. J25]|uniref:glucosamine-6-phosphate deaminase n=1 Tax=Treponema sp. J25 TaxID=2094121 RepID=UPI001046F0D5|nr:glucosamine-6-phosphate deaminase [Treponema sp. J25]TCW61158.1 glucosamine-6-phosphate deaminase [Treponema sp. J25]